MILEKIARNFKRPSFSLQLHVTNSTTTLDVNTMHLAHYPTLEAHLIDFLTFARAVEMPVTKSVLRKRALIIQKEVWKADRQVEEHAALEIFVASRGWVEIFVRLHVLRSVALHGCIKSPRSAGGLVVVRSGLCTQEQKTKTQQPRTEGWVLVVRLSRGSGCDHNMR